MSDFDVPQRIEDFALDMIVHVAEDRFVENSHSVSFDCGDAVLYLIHQDDDYIYGEGYRQFPPALLFYSKELRFALNWFILKCGTYHRETREMTPVEPIETGHDESDVANGYEIYRYDSQWTTLGTTGEGEPRLLPVRIFDDGVNGYSNAAQFSHVCDEEPEALLDLYLDVSTTR